MKKAYLLSIFILFRIFLHSQEYKDFLPNSSKTFIPEQFTIENGLSDNNILSILQDRFGFIWIGTKDGLNRFDGYTIRTFRYQPGDSTSISDNTINVLFEDQDGNLWIGTNYGLNLYDPLTESFKHFKHDPNDDNSISHNQVRAIYQDKQGILWFGTGHGLSKYNPGQSSFSTYFHQATHSRTWEDVPSHEISALGEDQKGRIMVGYWGMGLMLFDKISEEFSQVFLSEGNNSLNLVVARIKSMDNGMIWVIGHGFLYQYEQELLKRMLKPQIPIEKNIGTFTNSLSGTYLMGSVQGLVVLDQQLQKIEEYITESSAINFSQASSIYGYVSTAFEDQAGDIWIGTQGKGVYHLNKKGNHFINYPYLSTQSNSPLNDHVNALLEVEKDIIWVNTRRHGMNVYNHKNRSFKPLDKHIRYPNGINHLQGGALFKDSYENIWIGTWGKGLNLYRPDTQEFQYFTSDSSYTDSTTLADRFVTYIFETKEKEIWIGTPRGLSVLKNKESIEKGEFKLYRKHFHGNELLNGFNINCITQTNKGKIWVGTTTGLYRFDREKEYFFSYQHEEHNPNSLNNNKVNAIFEDHHRILWIATSGGLNRFNPETETFKHYGDQHGLQGGLVSQIREDSEGYLWLSTKTGITRFDPKKEEFKNFNAKDGLLNNRFNPNAFIQSAYTGTFFAGGLKGLSIFHPDQIKENSFIPPTFLTALTKYHSNGDSAISVKGIVFKDQIEFSYLENIITLELTTLNFRNTEKNQYAYKLEGFNEDWINIGNKREITFTNLDAGNYTLWVKGSNNDGIWNEEKFVLTIIVNPPWWETKIAYSIYVCLILIILFGIYRFLLKRYQLTHQLRTREAEAQRLKELDTFKSRLYTNLTHEFRTPLTIILGMVDQIHEYPKRHLKEGLHLIHRNGQQLLQLINQLLDLSKLENKSFQLHLQQGDIISYLRYLAESFHTYASSKELSLQFTTTDEEVMMDYDPKQVKQIMTNLLSNAIKFTPSGGSIRVRISTYNEKLCVEISDTGIGISKQDLPSIFDRFYQVDNSTTREGEGTGIGLAHTQELVKLMGGKIYVESALNEGTQFKIVFPIHKATTTPSLDEEISKDLILEDTHKAILPLAKERYSESVSKELPHLLIVEDNQDVVTYLRACLSSRFRIEVAHNGNIGLEKAIQQIPDIIISDIMMPEKDGYQLCYELKNDERTSHIPIILLTAKADRISKLSGLKTGADAYLAKPFDREELLIRLEKLFSLRQRMQTYFAKQFQQMSTSQTLLTEYRPHLEIEHSFIKKINHILEQNIEDEYFGLPNLCREIGMSRSQLFRKMKALTNTAPSEYIRKFRLKKAKHLLKYTDANVAEAAYQVGFKDPSYFSKIFKEEFGSLPSSTNK